MPNCQNNVSVYQNNFPPTSLFSQLSKSFSLLLKLFSFAKIGDSNCQNNFPFSKGIVSNEKKCHHSRANQNIEYKSRMPSLLPLCILVIFVAVPSTTAPGTCKIYHPNLRKIAFGRSALILVIPSTEGFFRRGAQGEFVEAHQRGGRGRKGQGAQKK